MKKKIPYLLLIIVLFIISTFKSFSQVKIEWVKNIGGVQNEIPFATCVDLAGNIYTTGLFQAEADFDPGPNVYKLTTSGSSDIFVSKLDKNGKFIWARGIGGVNIDEGQAIATDNSGNVYIAGDFRGTLNFAVGSNMSSITTAGERDFFIAKINSNGDFNWVKRIGGTLNDKCYSIAIDANENVCITGYFEGTVDFDPSSNVSNLVSFGFRDIFISKLDSSGNFIWAKRIGNSSLDEGKHIVLDKQNNIYVTGKFQESVDFDPNSGETILGSFGSSDIFITKFNSQGNLLWAKRMGGELEDIANCITLDFKKNIYITGSFEGNSYFNVNSSSTNMNSAGYNDVFVCKLDSFGNYLWANRIGGSLGDIGQSITVDSFENSFTAGFISSKVDFDPGVDSLFYISKGYSDAFICKLDATGKFGWVKTFGGSGFDECKSIVNRSNTILAVGFFNGVVNFDTSQTNSTLASFGESDFFALKINACENAIDTSIKLNGSTLTSNQTGAVYQWIDCNNFNKPIIGKTNRSFSPQTNGSYAVVITQGACIDTSLCYTLSTIDIINVVENTVLSVYPNPCKEFINISSKIDGYFNIVDNLGKVILSFKLKSRDSFQLNLSWLTTGLYFIQGIDNDIRRKFYILR